MLFHTVFIVLLNIYSHHCILSLPRVAIIFVSYVVIMSFCLHLGTPNRCLCRIFLLRLLKIPRWGFQIQSSLWFCPCLRNWTTWQRYNINRFATKVFKFKWPHHVNYISCQGCPILWEAEGEGTVSSLIKQWWTIWLYSLYLVLIHLPWEWLA